MNWKLILQLSLFGLAMGILTVFVIPSSIEPFCWLAIFVICAWVVAMRRVPQPFLHGLMISLVNSVWITSAHVILFDSYVARHAAELEMTKSMPFGSAPRMAMLVMGPIIGVISGIVLGLFCLVASWLMNRSQRTASPA